MDVLEGLLAHDDALTTELLARACSLPEGVLDQTFDTNIDVLYGGATLRSILGQLVGTKERWAAALTGRFRTGDELDDIESLQSRYERAGSDFLAIATSALREGRSEEMIIDASCDPPHTFTVGGAIAHVLTFAVLRRSVALGFLSSAGVSDLGFGDPSGYIAEH